MFHDKQLIKMEEMIEKEPLSYEYIRGLIEVRGSFTFSTKTRRLSNGEVKRSKIPAFIIKMHEKDEALLLRVRNTLDLPNKVYNYQQSTKDGYNRSRKTFLIVREIGSLKNIIIPLLYNRLIGYKRVQFDEWLEKIRSDSMVPENYDILYRLHENGYYASNPRFLN